MAIYAPHTVDINAVADREREDSQSKEIGVCMYMCIVEIARGYKQLHSNGTIKRDMLMAFTAAATLVI